MQILIARDFILEGAEKQYSSWKGTQVKRILYFCFLVLGVGEIIY